MTQSAERLNDRKAYILGATLLFMWPFAYFWAGGSTNLLGRFASSFVVSGATWVFFVVPHFAIQWLMIRALKRRNSSNVKILLLPNLPAALLAIGAWAHAYSTTRPANRFEEMLAKPIPSSVASIQQGGSRNMDHVFWVLRFGISQNDLEKLVLDQSYLEEGETDFADWKVKIEYFSKFGVALGPEWRVYRRKEGTLEKRIFFHRGRQEAIFVEHSFG